MGVHIDGFMLSVCSLPLCSVAWAWLDRRAGTCRSGRVHSQKGRRARRALHHRVRPPIYFMHTLAPRRASRHRPHSAAPKLPIPRVVKVVVGCLMTYTHDQYTTEGHIYTRKFPPVCFNGSTPRCLSSI
ncbi:hypothetical protein BC567DRAFT_2385 [Phyllosticta citribraziliensis]